MRFYLILCSTNLSPTPPQLPECSIPKKLFYGDVIRQWQEEWTGKIHVNYPKLSKRKKHYFSSQQHDRHGLPKSSRNILQASDTLGHPQSNMHNSVSQADKDHVLDLILPAEVTRDQVGDLAKGAFLEACISCRNESLSHVSLLSVCPFGFILYTFPSANLANMNANSSSSDFRLWNARVSLDRER